MVDVNTEVESQVDTPVVTERDTPSERPSVRESLERTFSDVKKREEKEEKESRRDTRRDTNRRDDTGKFAKTEEETTEQTEVEEQAEPQPEPQVDAPKAWAAEAKEAWSQLPEQVKAAVLKRETDVEKGIENLKSQYKAIDDALAPHIGAIKQFNKTPAEAVAQLFSWFQALAQNPDQAFPALIKSYNYDASKLLKAFGLEQKPVVTEQPKTEEVKQAEDDLPPAIKAYISKLEEKLDGFQNTVGQQLNGMQSNFAEQSMARTNETLAMWSKDKPYFQDVRVMMGHFLTPDPQTGVAIIPLKDGKVDLDAAYEQAIWANPQVRAKMLAEEQAKAAKAQQAKVQQEAKAQQEQADKARRASTSIRSNVPGAEVARKQIKPNKSVRESIMGAIEEHNA
jgi:hypothetical protein